MCKISVITPVYNVQEYLEKSIRSILTQTLTDFELIIIDDGSTDDSGKIADKLKNEDKRIRVVHKINGGAASARNEGIKVSKGKYLYFPDPDDWLDSKYLEILYNCAEKNNSKLVISGFTMEYSNLINEKESVSYKVRKKNAVYSSREEVRNNIHNYFNNTMFAVPWNKLFLSNYVKENSIFFPSVKWDDMHFNLEIVKGIDNVSICGSTGYHFLRLRSGSETTKVFKSDLYQKRREQFEHILKIYRFWNIKEERIYNYLYGYYGSRLIECIQEISTSNIKNKKDKISFILKDEFNHNALKKAQYESKIFKILACPLKYDIPSVCFFEGYLIGFIKENTSNTFYKLKSKFVNRSKEEVLPHENF